MQTLPESSSSTELMRVMCPHTQKGLHPDTRRVLLELPSDRYEVEFVDCVDNWSYHNAFNRYWREGQRFMIVEHDLVPTLEQLDELAACEYAWCTQPYTHPYHEGKHHTAIFEAFGVVCFKEWAMEFMPDITIDMLDIKKVDNKFARWIQLDSRFLSAATKRGVDRHKHDSIVTHWHWSNFSVKVDVPDLDSWKLKYQLPWDVVVSLNPHLPSVGIERCFGQTVSVRMCRPRPDHLFILNPDGTLAYDSRLHPGEYDTRPISPDLMVVQ
jgi:hypothetical protein